jgi:hypothetical protein
MKRLVLFILPAVIFGCSCTAEQSDCESDADCATSEICDPDTNKCVPYSPCSHAYNCVGKCGGDDGCGTDTDCEDNCPTGESCSGAPNWVCEHCQPDCINSECGPDPVCGETCGTCTAEYMCIDNNCVAAGFSARLRQFGDDTLINNAEVRALDNTTGAELGINAISGPDGWVLFEELPAGLVGFKVVAGLFPMWKDTYQYYFSSSAKNEHIWFVNEPTYISFPQASGLTPIAGNALFFGKLVWENTEGEYEDVGCATIEATPNGGVVRYFSDAGYPIPIDGRDRTNPLASQFMIVNVGPGQTTVTALINDIAVGSIQAVCFANSVCIADIVLGGASNPTPDWCE